MPLSIGQRTRLGIFLTVSILVALIMVAIPLGLKIADPKKNFLTFFEGESLSGLENGAAVKYRGIPIGTVTRISYDPKNLSRVKVTLRIDGEFPLKRDMVAEAGMIGITGLKYVEILGGSDTATLMVEGDTIVSRQSMFASITGKTESIIAKVEILLNHLNAITDPDSIREIRRIIVNVDEITATVNGFTKEISPQLTELATSATVTAHRIDSISADVHAMSMNLRTGIDGEKLAAIIGRIDSTVIAMKSLSLTLDLSIRQSREDFSVSMENLRATLENANELSKMLTENPSLLLKNENPKDRGQ